MYISLVLTFDAYEIHFNTCHSIDILLHLDIKTNIYVKRDI